MNFFILIYVLIFLFPPVHGQNAAFPSSYRNISDLFWPLHDLEGQQPKGNPYLGGQNFSWCCLKAFENALGVENGSFLIQNNSRSAIGTSSLAELMTAAERGQFPCGARYNGNLRGSPVVAASYDFLVEQCPGWELSSKNNVNQWLHSLSGFLLPAVIFCLSVPRRRKLYVPRTLFANNLAGIKSYLPVSLGALAAIMIILLDTTIWLGMCFAFAGPMILSGLYEAMLDSQVLEFLRDKIDNKRLSLHMRCRCLIIILIGNLDLDIESCTNPCHGRATSPLLPQAITPNVSPSTTMDVMSQRHDQLAEISAGALEAHRNHELPDARPDPPSAQTLTPAGTTTPSAKLETAHSTMTTLGQQQNFVSDNSQPGTAASNTQTAHIGTSPWQHMEVLLDELQLGTKDHITQAKTRLQPMLHCQYSFGFVVGAPVVFYLGGFLFASISSLEYLGNEDIAGSVSFGSWYMIIPHIAIVSGLLLSGNNPNIFEGVFATKRKDQPDNDSVTLLFGLLRFELAYPSCYKVAWQWQRGHNKKLWIKQLLETYGNRGVEDDYDLENLYARTNFSYIDWFFLLLLTLLLLGVPFVLAFLIAFYTPQTGLSCRSLNFAVSFCTQVAQIGLWLWAYAGPPAALVGDATLSAHSRQRSSLIQRFFLRGGWLDRKGFYTPTSINWLLINENKQRKAMWEIIRSSELWSFRAMWCAIYYFLLTVLGFTAILSSIGGTLMQIMGIYRTAICYINVQYWLAPIDQKPMAVLSTNSEEMIRNAIDYWIPCAIAAGVFMACAGFAGWWYQTRTRDIFRQRN